MPLLQAQFIQPNVGDHTLGIDLSILGQLILDDPVYRLGRDSQATGNLLRRAADQRTEHELLEAISVGYVLAFERGDNVLPVVTPRTAMEGSLVNPETGLLPQVEVPDRLGACFELDVGDVVVATFFTTASCGQGPPHLQAMAVLIPLVTGDFHLGNKVDIDGDPSHGPSVLRDQRRLLMHDNKRTGYDKTVRNPRPRTLKRKNQTTSGGKQMTADIHAAGAASHAAEGWHTINWKSAYRIVCRLQARIVKAIQEGRWGKVKALQYLLTHSFSGKALAIRRVTENQGKGTPGVDREVWDTPEKKATALQALRQRGYNPQPLRRVYIPKKNGKMRPLGIPTMRDRAMQALYLQALDPIAETMADPNSYGFRKERSTADAIEQCHIVLSNRGGARWIFEGDIKSCFDRISHEWLMAHIPMCKTILQKWLKAGFMEKHEFYATEEGTPQGGICSPVLANMALDGLERELRGRYPKASALSRKAKVNLVRYADDFIITGSSKKLLEEEVKPLVESFLKERGLELSAEKTHITRIEDGFDFLGQNVRDYGGTIVVKPSRKNVATFLEKVRGIIKASKHVTAGHLIVNLNPVIRGWANYHRHVASKRTFSRVDHAIFRALWQWAKRRHPKKSRQWIKDRYFETIDQRHWVFHGTVAGREEVIQPVWLLAASSVPIQRHTKVKGEANPYDPAWEPYFEERLGVKMAGTLAGRWTLRLLWKEQGGICPVCNQKITTVTGWHNHHIVWRTHGGKDTIENRVLVHPNCHQQIHSQELDVGKPRPAKGVREA